MTDKVTDKNSSRFGKRGRSFLQDFFKPVADGPGTRASYFEETFEEPPDFEQLVSAIKPDFDERTRRVIIIDGQSRVGKTWAVIGAMATLLDREPACQLWSGGEDSQRIFAGSDQDDGLPRVGCTNILAGVSRIVRAIQSRKPNLVFLDDFLGTVRLRPLAGSDDELSELNAYFDWTRDDNLLRNALPRTGGTLVLTNRSTLLTVAAVRLGFPFRPIKPIDLAPIRKPRGFFRGHDGKLTGAFTENELNRILERNESHRGMGFSIDLPHVVAFAPKAPRQFTKRPEIADALFGADLNELAFEVLDLESELESYDESEAWALREPLTTKLKYLDRAYLLSIAPGLVFPGPSFHNLLGIDAHAKELVDVLYLLPNDSSIRPGRIPNEFYARALKSHLSDVGNVALAARVIKRLSEDIIQADATNSDSNKTHNLRVSIRGLLERTIGQARRSARNTKIQLPSALADLIDEYNDPLFEWETLTPPESHAHDEWISKPGFIASLGWDVFHFPILRQGVGDKAVDWFVTHLQEKLQGAADNDRARDLIVASYSTFLQWAIRIDLSSAQSNILQKLKPSSLKGDHSEVLPMVFDDELIWAATLGKNRSKNISIAANLMEMLEQDDPNGDSWDDRTAANRLFSLSWHNEWLDRDTGTSQVFGRWIDRCGERAKEVVRRHPEILDQNLQYHWWHFITQYGDWMRNWCFHHDPYKHERDRVAAGTKKEKYNEVLLEIIGCALKRQSVDDWPTFSQRVRNCLMLVGTRSGRIKDDIRFLDLVESLRGRSADSHLVLQKAILHSVFELTRQGYLDSGSRDASTDFRAWCREQVVSCSEEHVNEAWLSYKEELEQVTHLDLLPRSWLDLGGLI